MRTLMNHRFRSVDMYRYFPSVGIFQDGQMTLKFTYTGQYSAIEKRDTWERIGVIVTTRTDTVYLYVDEKSNLYKHPWCTWYIGSCKWNGEARVDLERIKVYIRPKYIWE